MPYADNPYPSREMRMLAAIRIWGVLHYFDPSSQDGFNPYSGVTQGTDGYLYGVTSSGGIIERRAENRVAGFERIHHHQEDRPERERAIGDQNGVDPEHLDALFNHPTLPYNI